MTKNIQGKMNELLGESFGFNAFADNIAYNLAIKDLPKAEASFHKKFAHFWPSDAVADGISTFLVQSGVRPVRKGIPTFDKDYEDLRTMFTELWEHMNKYKEIIHELIAECELSVEDTDCCLFLEELSLALMPYLHQTKIWQTKADQMNDNPAMFDNYFKSFTLI